LHILRVFRDLFKSGSLSTREQTRLDFCWQSMTGSSWQKWRLCSWTHLMTSSHSS